MTEPTAAYVHVPFCRHRCGYCDFTLVAGRDDLRDRYLAALSRELRYHPEDPAEGTSPLDTLFLGGGTPTHLTAEGLRQLFAMLRERFTWDTAAEVSVEANPLDLTDERLDVLLASGVTRISLGLQSFAADVLTTLERDHRPTDIAPLLARLQRRCENVSLDLMFGVPGQSLASWKESLQQAIDTGVPHVSTYGLTYEPGTAFTTRRKRGELTAADEELEREMYAFAMDLLTTAGFEHYEISNFAQPGFRCRHNLVYWRGEPYWAYGPGAARYVATRRETNVRSVLGWLARLEAGLNPTADVEKLDGEHRARELIFLGLRTSDGIDRAEFQRRTGFVLEDLAGAAIRWHQENGWLVDDGRRIALTRSGRFIADRIVADYL